jgi:drug/metabolite transporter (DMT)-like permease
MPQPLKDTIISGSAANQIREGPALFALLMGANAIAFAPIFVRLSQAGPVATAFWRVALSLPVLWAWLMLSRQNGGSHRTPSSPADYWRLLAAGWFFAGDLTVWHWSIRLTSVANATLLANFAPVFVTLGSWMIFGRRVRLVFLLGMVMALAGMTLIVGNSFKISLFHFWGDILGLITAVFYAAYQLSVKHLREDFKTVTIMFWSGLPSALTLLGIALLSKESLLPVSTEGWMVLIGLALISHVGGQSLIAYALAHLSAAFSSVGLLVQPVTAAILAWLILSETLGMFQALGGILVLIGILIARRGSQAD